jgi:spermidine synthase
MDAAAPVTVERVGELALRRTGDHYEIISNGVFLMDTRGGGSERLLVRAALDRLGRPARVLIAGLGVGFTLAEALRDRAAQAVTVVEREPAVIRWQATHLERYSGGALRDPRVRLVHADFVAWVRADTGSYDVICLDVDNGPDWTVTDGNAALYDRQGLATLARRLRLGGLLAVWSAHPSAGFEERLRAAFADVTALRVPVRRGEPDVVYLARAPRPEDGDRGHDGESGP